MLINRVSVDDEHVSWMEADEQRLADHATSHNRVIRAHDDEYQTANELFEMMAKNHSFEYNDNSLSASDLVILYKNIEVGTKLISDAEQFNRRKPNQYIETIIYNDESDDSDCCETYNNYDWRDVALVNKERIDLLSNPSSLENILSHKFGDLEIRNSHIPIQYDKHFIFKDPYIKEQLKNINIPNISSNDLENTIFPASLLDYICCKRLEDNYNFYLDNVIRYVKHALEQLKRISNGDYLTDKAKEKWREVESTNSTDATKILATCASIPLHLEQKATGRNIVYDDMIRSEVDVRSLSKILEKKIIVEVPKFIHSYKLFSELYPDNLIVSCQKGQINESKNNSKNKRSRLDVVLRLNGAAKNMSNINSIMILQAIPPIEHDVASTTPALIPLPYSQDKYVEDNKTVQILEIQNDQDDKEGQDNNIANVSAETQNILDSVDPNIYYNDNDSKNDILYESNDSSIISRDILDTRPLPNMLRKEAPFNFIPLDALTLSMDKMNMSCVPEENLEDVTPFPVNKRRSPTKVRIKSPYENKSHIIDEKKRKRFLEIRERREKRKIAMSDSYKKNKQRYARGSIMPQSSSSVTKLSITNKSFYNSIYGQNINNFDKSITKIRTRKGNRDLVTSIPIEQLEEEHETTMSTPDKNIKKYVNRSYYLDDAVTEVMYAQHSDCSSDVRELFSASTPLMSNDKGSNLTMHSKPIKEPSTNINISTPCENMEIANDSNTSSMYTEECRVGISCSRNVLSEVPTYKPNESNKTSTTLECRKSINKIYDLIKNIGKVQSIECKSFKLTSVNSNQIDANNGPENSIVPFSDSGTSLKHHFASSNPSSFSLIQTADDVNDLRHSIVHKEPPASTSVVPKVIINSKQQAGKYYSDKPKKERKKVTINPPLKISDNPLKAISRLLHEFDNVQKSKQSKTNEPKTNKNLEVSFETRNMHRTGSFKKRTRFDQPVKDELQPDKNGKDFINRERKGRPIFTIAPLKKSQPQTSYEDKHIDRMTKKTFADIIDEVKEAKGEAVRGPPKFNSRLNTLAQPKKSYVQAHSEEYQNKYGRNLMADRLQRLASTSVAAQNRDKPNSAGIKGKQRRNSIDITTTASVRQPPSSPLEQRAKYRRSTSNRPIGLTLPIDVSSYKQSHESKPPEILKNKMVAVESYVQSHYGGAASSSMDEGPLPPTRLALVPLVPRDLDLGSVPSSPTGEESTAIGSKLHRIIDNMINSKPMALSTLPETYESVSKLSKQNICGDDDVALTENQFKEDNPSSIDSDYRADIFADNHVKTAVEIFPRERHEGSVTDEMSERYNESVEESCRSSTELQKLEEALYRQISVGTFQKRLRMKNLTLTPKHSTQQLFLMQSGIAGGLVLKSTLSKNSSSSGSNKTTDIKSLPTLINSQLEWKLQNIPMQITTVGYAFPAYNAIQCNTKAIKSLQYIFKANETSKKESNVNKNSKQCLEIMTRGNFMQDMQLNAISTNVNLTDKTKTRNTNQYSEATEVNEPIEALQEMSAAINKSVDRVEIFKKKNDLEDINCTSSLDVLMSLLNEIQKITACHISNTVNSTDGHACEKLENMCLNDNAVEHKDSCELVSLTSLDNLRQLDSSPSIYSLYISNDESESVKNLDIPKLFKNVLYSKTPSCVDKEVNVDFTKRQLTNTLTDVPSKLFPVTMAHSTTVTSSLLGILSKPSSIISSLMEFETLYPDLSLIGQKTSTTNNTERALALSPKFSENILRKIKIVKEKNVQRIPIVSTNSSSLNNKYYMLSKNFYTTGSVEDPIFKMKRDILVTMYSMLVLTVFAALSLPDMLFYT